MDNRLSARLPPEAEDDGGAARPPPRLRPAGALSADVRRRLLSRGHTVVPSARGGDEALLLLRALCLANARRGDGGLAAPLLLAVDLAFGEEEEDEAEEDGRRGGFGRGFSSSAADALDFYVELRQAPPALSDGSSPPPARPPRVSVPPLSATPLWRDA
jgi:hypothetical protein